LEKRQKYRLQVVVCVVKKKITIDWGEGSLWVCIGNTKPKFYFDIKIYILHGDKSIELRSCISWTWSLLHQGDSKLLKYS
jgi:hypothetical protein